MSISRQLSRATVDFGSKSASASPLAARLDIGSPFTLRERRRLDDGDQARGRATRREAPPGAPGARLTAPPGAPGAEPDRSAGRAGRRA